MKRIFLCLTFCTFILSSFAQFETFGCTDPLASNYNPQANSDDGTCCYEDFYITFSSNSNAYFNAFNNQGQLFGEAYFPGTFEFCVPAGCQTFYISSNDGTPVSCTGVDQFGNTYSINSAPSLSTSLDITLGEGIVGCMTPGACNYNPEATCYASCDFNCLGCTDAQAFNYDPSASVDDGSCCTNPETYYTIESDGIVDFIVYDPISGVQVAGEYPTDTGFCIDQPCFEIYIYDNLGQTANVTIYNQGNVVLSGTVDLFNEIFYNIGSNGISGCADPNACNFDPEATCNSYTTCTYDCYGCTDPAAINYDETATIDDGTCCSSENYLSVTATSTFQLVIYNSESYNTVYINAGETVNVCVNDGCYTGYASNLLYDGAPSTLTITDPFGNILFDFTTDSFDMPVNFSYNATQGCLDTNACNYDPSVNCGDPSLCDYSCQGCTNPEASNFDPDATIDNGTCCIEQWTINAETDFYFYLGLTNIYTGQFQSGFSENNQATLCINPGCLNLTVYDLNYAPITYTITNGSGEIIEVVPGEDPFMFAPYYFDFQAISGCGDASACNFNPNANCFDYSACDYSCFGCTDAEALNFNPNATTDNGTCCYNNYYTLQLSGEAYWSVASNNYYDNYSYGQYPLQSGFCSDSECFNLYFYSFNGLPLDYSIIDQNGVVIASGTNNGFGEVVVSTDGNQTVGCAEPNACNFDPNVTCGTWYLCDYSCYGCTNAEAFNYDSSATIDDGSCCTDNWNTVSLSAPGYWYVYNFITGQQASGMYPEQTGFCGIEGCFYFEAYSIGGESLTYSITNNEGVVLGEGIAEYFNYAVDVFSTNDEVPGCTDPNACNFDPNATCEIGNCQYYCGGCTDIQALNYNPLAQFEDGSCFYQMESPLINFDIDEFTDEGVYYVRAAVMSLGNGAPYLLSTSDGEQMTMINDNGQYVLGPFPCGQDVMVNLNSTSLGMTQFMASDPMGGNCLVVNNEEVEDASKQINVFPNPANDQINITGLADGTNVVRMIDMTGRIVLEQQINSATQAVLDVTALSAGLYQLSIQNNNVLNNTSVVIKK